MPVITINGPIGCGSATLGKMVAEKLNIEFVDRLVFAQAAKVVRAPVEALIDKGQRVARFRDRLGHGPRMPTRPSPLNSPQMPPR